LEAEAVINGENGENEPERLKRNNYNYNHYNYNYNYKAKEPGKACKEDRNLEQNRRRIFRDKSSKDPKNLFRL
jgi:hypothetical protein